MPQALSAAEGNNEADTRRPAACSGEDDGTWLEQTLICAATESSRRPPLFTGGAECMRMVNLQSLTWHMACISDMSETMPVSASMFSDAIEY